MAKPFKTSISKVIRAS